MITKADEAGILKKAIESVAEYIDEIIVVTDKAGSLVDAVVEELGGKVYYREWDDNFANQRNFCFEQATGDWIMWLDSDDIVKNPHKIRPLLKIAPRDAKAIVVNYVYERDKYGNTLVEHWRERIVRKEGEYKWVGVLHETLVDNNNPPVVKTKDFEIIHEHPDFSGKISERNVKILEKEIARQKDAGEEVDPRLVYYLGVSYKAMGVYDMAERLLNAFCKVSGWDEQRYDAYIQLSEIGVGADNMDVAADYALLAIKERPDYPDAYYQLGNVYAEFGKFEKCRDWIEVGLSKKQNPNSDWVIQARKPQALLNISVAYTNLGQFEESNKCLEELKTLWPRERGIKKAIKENNRLVEHKKISKSFLDIARYNNKYDKSKNKKLIEAIPKTHKDNPITLQLKWTYGKSKTWDNKSIVIYCGTSFDEWSPKIVKRGIGGSEEAVINMSLCLTKLGYNVTVYNNCGKQDGTYDGVEYKNHWECNFNDQFNIFIGWRTPELFYKSIKADKKYLWMHDVVENDTFNKTILNNVDKVILLSKYHRSLFPNIPEDKVFYSNNGIDPKDFEGTEDRDPNRLIYASCPSRGLEHLAEMWSSIRKVNPKAELHVYYGWENYIKGNQNYPKRMEWMYKLQANLKQDGIIDHGRIGHKELAREFMRSSIWAYPTEFPEINCITAMKAQAAGCIPVTTGFAALEETQQYGAKAKLEQFLPALLDMMKNQGEFDREKMAKWSLENNGWEQTARCWRDNIL